jgi:DeoR/GlpR family transcriptional regulator of sugar metabolism
MIPEERRQKIVDYIESKKTATIPEIGKEFGVSEITVRRDLNSLSSQGMIRKTYGGATAVNTFIQEPVFLQRIYENREEKKRIAAEAVRRISDGDTVLIESGSTCLELVKFLSQKKDIRVITTAPHILNALCDLKRAGRFEGEILCCGGLWRQEPDIFVGPQAMSFFDSIRINIAFFGLVAINLKDGWMGSNIFEAELTKKIISSSEKIIGVTVHTKFEKISFTKIGSLTLFSEIITDNNLPPETLERYRKAMINVTVC